MKYFFYRVYQTGMRAASYLIPWRKPIIIDGENSIEALSSTLLDYDYKRVLIITDKALIKLGILDSLFKDLKEKNIYYAIFDETVANPTIKNVEDALEEYLTQECTAIIAFGGGSPIDCGKAVAARVARPKKNIKQLRGFLKVRKQVPPVIAIPTTSGTGSETTLAAVITNGDTHEKFAINDIALIPKIAVLDPNLTIKLPPHITSTTGMDALTHAIEAYIGRSNTKETLEMSRNAVDMIFNSLKAAYIDGNNIEARTEMQKASYYAGIAFTRAYIGYVHALAHQLGGVYSTPHGLANAIILPYVLEYYGKSIHKQLAELADLISISNDSQTEEEKAKLFINEIKNLNKDMNIPTKINEIKDQDIELMVERAYKEANPSYPVPKILNRKDLTNIYRLIMT
jgi:alcohol dehydrogenase class IV